MRLEPDPSSTPPQAGMEHAPGRPAPRPESTLEARLDALTAPGELCRLEGGWIRCLACAHRCRIAPGRRGLCRVRSNTGGQLRVPFGYVAGVQCDPIEKKPFFHVQPGSDALTFGMLGCNFHCGYCQNWISSQGLREKADPLHVRPVDPAALAHEARRLGASLLVSSYNEPLITSEWAAAVFRQGKAAGLRAAIVSNGYATPEAIDYLRPWISACKVDLKGFDDRRYRRLGGALAPVLDTIRRAHACGIWLEVVTLLVPGFNDLPGELESIARFLVSVSPDIPWHVTAFHPDYRMTDRCRTTADDLLRAAQIGVEAGLHFVYAGNLPGQLAEWENTRCPRCRSTLIRRRGFDVLDRRLGPDGCCPGCGQAIPGLWRA